MSRTTESISLTLKPSTLRAIDAAAQASMRSRSQTVDLLLARALTGDERLDALKAVATLNMEQTMPNDDGLSARDRQIEMDAPTMARCPTPPPAKPQPSSTPSIGAPLRPLRPRPR